jgi:hypothetical protein
MKRIITLLSLSAVALALPMSSIAAEKEKAATSPKKTAEKATTETKAAAETTTAAKAEKPIPMHVRADAIDAKTGTFTMKRKDGVEVKHVITDKTEIKNGEAAAKLADIKPGEYVSGLRVKKGETEYEVVKITKFGPAPDKEAAPSVGEAPKEKK